MNLNKTLKEIEDIDLDKLDPSELKKHLKRANEIKSSGTQLTKEITYVGQRVKITPSSVFYDEYGVHPIDEVGIVIDIDNWSYPVTVKWLSHQTPFENGVNTYDFSDLEMV